MVDVKPQHRVSKPEVTRTFGWTRAAVESRGWTYEVWSGTDSVKLENLRLLAGFRRHWLFNPELLRQLHEADLDGVTLGDACRRQREWAEPLVRAGVLHLLWTHELTTELSRPLSADHLLRRTA